MGDAGARNVETVARLYRLEESKDFDAWVQLWSDDVRVTFPLSVDPSSGRVDGLHEWAETTRQKFADRETIRVDAQIEGLADPLRVLARLQVHLTFVTGLELKAPLLVLFTFNPDGLISVMEEYVNEAAISQQLGRSA